MIYLLSKFTMKIRHVWGIIYFRSSKDYWIKRYKRGDKSGKGSYGKSAKIKADFVNNFVEKYAIQSIIEFGCGDGNQLKLSKYPSYIGYDISPKAIELCKSYFIDDHTKSFFLMEQYNEEKADLSLSLDVIYHLVEDDVFVDYMNVLFNASRNFTIIYSTNTENFTVTGSHIKHRRFTEWVKENLPEWELVSHFPSISWNVEKIKETNKVDFFVYQKNHLLA